MAGIYSGVNVTLGHEYADKSFYGFRLDAPNGQLYFDFNNGVAGVPVSIPDEYATSAADYLIYFWSSDTIKFSINGTNGRLLMEYK
jgi:hypothetical protein